MSVVTWWAYPPNQGMQATAYSVRCAPVSRRA